MAEVCTLDWHIAPFRADRWLDLWEPAAAKMPAYGARSWSLTRSIDDPLAFRQDSIWDSRTDFERYWYSEEIEAARASIIDMHDLPILPAWSTVVSRGVAGSALRGQDLPAELRRRGVGQPARRGPDLEGVLAGLEALVGLRRAAGGLGLAVELAGEGRPRRVGGEDELRGGRAGALRGVLEQRGDGRLGSRRLRRWRQVRQGSCRWRCRSVSAELTWIVWARAPPSDQP